MGAKKTSKAWIGWVISGVVVLGVAGSTLPIENQSINQTNEANYINTYNENIHDTKTETNEKTSISLSEIPAYSGNPYIEINNNIPFFKTYELTTASYEKYSNLDSLRKMWGSNRLYRHRCNANRRTWRNRKR